jgi:hypothetical protein
MVLESGMQWAGERNELKSREIVLIVYFIRHYITVFFNLLPALLIVTLCEQRQAVRPSATCTASDKQQQTLPYCLDYGRSSDRRCATAEARVAKWTDHVRTSVRPSVLV